MTKNYEVPAPTAAQVAQYERTGCSAAEKRVAVNPPTFSARKMTKAEVKAEAHRLALKYGAGVE